MEATTQTASVRRNAGNRAARRVQVEVYPTVIASSTATSEAFGLDRVELTATATMDLASDEVRFAFARRAIDGTQRIGQISLSRQEIPALLALLSKVGAEADEAASWVAAKRQRAR